MDSALARWESVTRVAGWDPAEVDSPIQRSVPPGARTAFHHFGLHPFPGRKDPNVIQTYILHHTQPGDTVLDPFVGSGTTAREALILRRRVVVADINPISELITRGSIIPVDFLALENAFGRIEREISARILEIDALNAPRSITEAEAALNEFDLSFLDAPLPRVMGRGVARGLSRLRDLHDPRQILGLLLIRDAIAAEWDPALRLVLQLAFSRSLKYATKMYSAEGFVRGRPRLYVEGNATPFRNLSYNLPKAWAYKNVWSIFAHNYNSVVKAKQAFWKASGDFPREGETFIFLRGDAAQLPSLLEQHKLPSADLADYCITDPPYAEVVPYPEVFSLWYAWLGVTPPDLAGDLTVVARPHEARHPTLVDQFVSRLSGVLATISNVLRDGCWLTLFYQHKNLAYWSPMTRAASTHGLEFQNVVPQPAQIPSFAKLQHPFATLAETMIVNFRRCDVVRARAPGEQLLFPSIRKYAELEMQRVIVECLGADTETITYHLISVLLDPRLMSDRLAEAVDVVQLLKAQNLEPLGAEHGDRSEDLWLLREGVQVDPLIDVYDRLRYDLFSFVRRHRVVAVRDVEVRARELLARETANLPGTVDLTTLLTEFAVADGAFWQYSAEVRRRTVQPRLVLVRSSAPRLAPRLFGAPEGTLRLRVDNLDLLGTRFSASETASLHRNYPDLRNLLLAVLSEIRDQFSDQVAAVYAIGDLGTGDLPLDGLQYEDIVLGVDSRGVREDVFALERALSETVFARVFLETGIMFVALTRTSDEFDEWSWTEQSLMLLDAPTPSPRVR